MMNHNPHNLKVGDRVVLDDEHEVTIVSMTPQKMFSKVEAGGVQWEVMTSRLNMNERILCAAIWFKSFERPVHRPINTPGGVVLCGHRHGHVIGQFVALTGKKMHEAGEYIQGFLTSRNRFLDRKEAAKLWKEQGNKLEFDDINQELFSEDLY